MPASHTIVDFWPVPEPDAAILRIAQAPYLQRRTVMHVRMNPPRPPHFHYKFRELKRVDSPRASGPEFTETSIQQLSSTLIDSLLWLSSPEDFNDPFDTWVVWTIEGTDEQKLSRLQSLADEHLSHLTPQEREAGLRNAMQTTPDEMLPMLRASFAEQRRRFGICCFAGDPRDVLMWSHYAGSHSGICLQFETARDPRVFMRALSVDYVDKPPVINWINEIHSRVGESFTQKHRRWVYEREHRIIQHDRAHCYIRFLPAALTGIIFGCKADDDVKRTVGKLLFERRSRGMPPVKLYYAHQHVRENRIQIWGDESGAAAQWSGRTPLGS